MRNGKSRFSVILFLVLCTVILSSCGLLEKEHKSDEPAQGTLTDDNAEIKEESKKDYVTDLTEYLGQNIHEVSTVIGNMEENHVTSGGFGYKNEAITVEARKDTVTFLMIQGDSSYSICGITYGMKVKDTLTDLKGNGWVLEQETEQYWYLKNKTGDTISLYSETKETVSQIRYLVSEDYQEANQSSEQTSIMTEDDIYKKLVEHYKKGTVDSPGDGMTVLEGYFIDGNVYATQVRCGVPGNPTATQRLYEIEVNATTGEVTQTNVLIGNQVMVFNLNDE